MVPLCVLSSGTGKPRRKWRAGFLLQLFRSDNAGRDRRSRSSKSPSGELLSNGLLWTGSRGRESERPAGVRGQGEIKDIDGVYATSITAARVTLGSVGFLSGCAARGGACPPHSVAIGGTHCCRWNRRSNCPLLIRQRLAGQCFYRWQRERKPLSFISAGFSL